MTKTNYPVEKIYKYITWGVVFVAIITILEFISKNFLNWGFNILRIADENNATYGVGGQRFFRARGTTVESGHLAMYLLMFVPFVYHYQKNINQSKAKLVFSLIVVTLSLIFTFSAAGFVELSIILLIVAIIKIVKLFRKGFKLSSVVMIYPVFCGVVFLSMYYFLQGDRNLSFITGIIDKITLVNYSIDDGGSRLARWYRALELFKEKPLMGHGPGISSLLYGTGSTSLYLEILIATGLVGLCLFLGVMLYHLTIILKIKGNLKYVYLVSFVTMSIHLAIISNYWYPWMWTLFALINVQYWKQNRSVSEIKGDRKVIPDVISASLSK